MLENLSLYEEHFGLAKRRFKDFETKSIHPNDLESYEKKGWSLFKKLKTVYQIKKPKTHGVYLEDRVWSLFYKMKFGVLSGEGGAKLVISPKDEKSPKTQIDIVAIDREIAIAIECKSSSEYRKRPEFQEELGKFSQIKEQFSRSVKTTVPEEGVRRQNLFIMFLNKVHLSDNDKERAKSAKIILFDETDLAYYESLINHLGPAAKYQILSDMLPGKEIPGLFIKIPAIKSKMGGYNCYSFSISPEYLLKISYVSHRSKGRLSDINTYQRMLSKSRLSKIRKFIENNGVFPTNIVLNLEKGRVSFQKTRQEGEDDIDAGVLGWLDIKAAYKSAWIIDGQHRLFAYSGTEITSKTKLSVLAFEGLPPSKQAEMFIDINAEQKSVKQSLLQELYAELNWDSDDPATRISAIISRSIQDLNADRQSALHQRIQSSDGVKDKIRCITLTSLFVEIEKKGFHIIKEKKGGLIEFGPLWASEDNSETLKRTNYILKGWFNLIAEKNDEWWKKGSDEGGGLAMNDGVSTCINVLRSVFDFLKENKKHKLLDYADKELFDLVKPYGEACADYLSSLTNDGRKTFRDLRGEQGVARRTRMIHMYMRDKTGFNPEGLDKWIEEQKLETNKKGEELVKQIERSLLKHIIGELKREFGDSEEDWWLKGVPKTIRLSATTKREDDDNKRGGSEFYLDLINFQKIILYNWLLFEKTFGIGKGSKDKKTDWIGFVNDLRKITAHPTSGRTISLENLTKLQEISEQLHKQLTQPSSEEESE